MIIKSHLCQLCINFQSYVSFVSSHGSVKENGLSTALRLRNKHRIFHRRAAVIEMSNNTGWRGDTGEKLFVG